MAGEKCDPGSWCSPSRNGWARPAPCGRVLLRPLSGQLFVFYVEIITVEASSEGDFNERKTSPLRFVVRFADH